MLALPSYRLTGVGSGRVAVVAIPLLSLVHMDAEPVNAYIQGALVRKVAIWHPLPTRAENRCSVPRVNAVTAVPQGVVALGIWRANNRRLATTFNTDPLLAGILELHAIASLIKVLPRVAGTEHACAADVFLAVLVLGTRDRFTPRDTYIRAGGERQALLECLVQHYALLVADLAVR